jgi:flagellin
MASIINTNHSSLTAQRTLHANQSEQQTPLQRLSSGKRINSAKDDAAGLAIAVRLANQVLGSNQAIRNTSDGVSLAQTAEGGMQEISTNLQRLRELAVQSSNGTLSSSDRQSLQNEFQSLQSEIQRVAGSTEFNGVNVLGSAQSLTFQVGANAGSSDQITVSTVDVANDAGINPAITTATIDTASAANSALGSLDAAIGRVSELRSDFGTLQNRFESTIRNTETSSENLAASRSRIEDADYAQETANLSRNLILQQSNIAALAQANATPSRVLSLLNG